MGKGIRTVIDTIERANANFSCSFRIAFVPVLVMILIIRRKVFVKRKGVARHKGFARMALATVVNVELYVLKKWLLLLCNMVVFKWCRKNAM